MDRDAAVKTWREVCGSDTVMAMGVVTGRMLEEFARRIEAAERERQDFQADTACEDRCRSLKAELDRLRAENERLRKIAAHVPAATYIAAKERAGFGVAVTPNTSISASGAEARE